MENVKKNRYKLEIEHVYVIYWAILVLWQNINPQSTGSLFDTIIKIGLLMFLTLYCLFHSKISLYGISIFMILSISILITMFTESSISIRMILNYFFPILYVFLTFFIGGEYEINKKRYVFFLNCIIVIVLYIALYSIIVLNDEFVAALNTTNAYGSELSSFFTSNHEFALYLVAGITSCIVCLELNKNLSKIKKLFYFASIVIFFANLILTFSRSYILTAATIILVYMFFNRKTKIAKKFCFLSVIAILVVFGVPTIRSFIFKVVFKDNNLAGRDVLASTALDMFERSNLFNQIFGYGVGNVIELFRTELSHASVHNAYLQVLLNFGLMGLTILVLFLIYNVVVSIRTIKKEKFIGTLITGLSIACIVPMITTTSIIFTSQIDSFFLTMFMIVIPKYVRNSINNGNFYDEEFLVQELDYDKSNK